MVGLAANAPGTLPGLLKRGQQCLEDGDWEKAKDFYDQVLSMDAENADAFLGLALAASRASFTASARQPRTWGMRDSFYQGLARAHRASGSGRAE